MLRRFDLSARFYLVAFAAGVVGISLGTLMGAGSELAASPSIRMVHAAGVALVAGLSAVAVILATVWAADFGVRLARVAGGVAGATDRRARREPSNSRSAVYQCGF